MMMLWLSCLLIGSITCRPVEKAYGSEAPAAAPAIPNFQPMFPGFVWDMGRPSSGSSSSLTRLSSGKPSQSSHDVPSSASAGGFGDERYNSAVSGYGAPYAASQSSGYGDSASSGSYGGGYGSSDSGYGDSATSGSYGGGYGSSASGYGDSATSGSYGGGYGSSASGYGDSATGGSYGGYGLQDESSEGAGEETPEPVFSDVSDLDPVYSFSSRSSYQRGQAVFAQTRYTPGGDFAPTFPSSSGGTSQPNAPAKAPAKGGF